jgi:putative transposase
MGAYVVEHHQISISRACSAALLPKSMYHYKSRKDDSETITKFQEIAGINPTEGQDLYY